MQSLRRRADYLLEQFDPETVTFFSTKDTSKADPQYFLKSANNISFFLEEDALDQNGKLKQAKHLSVNKIAHALHDIDEVFMSFSRSQKIANLLKELKYKSPIPVQSMYICKQPRIGGFVMPHQDDWFLRTDPSSVIGLWVALEDATVDNGCLYIKPKSHMDGSILRFGVENRNEPMKILEGERKECDLSEFTPIPVKAGTLVVLHGKVWHYSNENHSEESRHAYSVHYIEGCDDYHWHEENWLQRSPDFPFEALY